MTHTQTKPEMQTALVLGATGGIGSAVARSLLDRGYTVRAMHRDAATQARKTPHYEWVRGDAMNRDDVMNAARGVDLIVHAVNPPGYRNWGKLVVPMVENTIAAAEAVGALILMPGTVYNYGPEEYLAITEDSPQQPATHKGKIRVELEQRLDDASRRGIQVILVRAGDFFGPGFANGWLAESIIKPGRAVTMITTPGDAGIGHQWAYLPDVAETMMQLLERADDLPAFARFNMKGVWDHDGEQLAASIRRVTGRPWLRVKRLPWWLLKLAAPFVPFFREVLEMRYLWRKPVFMGNDRLVAFLGAEPHTPLDKAMRETLQSLGCLEDPVQSAAAAGSALSKAGRVSA
ncbi:NAD-dependent epimerase/dehydratase family protein [uncultured Hoeflea sp.]|uniref:NAD-dependent epimerase/dehydratase family protein n=1 Tax=uncultured Hoeflea sp. TaxID=538666 RepID=UPI0030EE78EA